MERRRSKFLHLWWQRWLRLNIRDQTASSRIHTVLLFMLLGVCGQTNGQNLQKPNGLDFWQSERPKDMANIVDLEVMCGKRHMEVAVTFDKPFNGIIFSKGAVDRYNCIYVKPQTGLSKYKFDIMYDSCGSKPDLNGRFYENNIVIQYDKDLIEVWDEAKRLRCEWYNDYEKGVTKPPIRVSDIEVVELNFRGDNVDCWMEIQQGKGPWASPVTGIVPLGTTLTMVVGIDDKEGEFDMRVKSCEASDNQNRPIQLSDSDGCVLRPKMVSKFMKMRSTDPRATVVTYAFFHAFKFPDSMAVHIKCKVEICRYGCPDHCQSPTSYTAREQEVSSNLNSYAATSSNRRVFPPPPPVPQASNYNPDPRNNRIAAGSIYAPELPRLPRPQALVSENKPRFARKNSEIQEEDNQDEVNRVGQAKSAEAGLGDFLGGLKLPELPELPLPSLPDFPTLPSIFGGSKESAAKSKSDNGQAIPVSLGIKPDTDEASSGPVPVHRTLNQGQPLVFPSSFNTAGAHVKPIEPLYNTKNGYAIPYGPRALHVGADGKTVTKREAEEVLSRQERSADIGVQSGYEVVSEVDLDFTPDEVQRSVATFQGKIQEDVIYGVCLPATGFSALFVLLALMTVVSVIVSAFICYHRQLAKVAEEAAPEPTAAAAAAAASINPGTVQTSLMLKEFNAWFRKQHQQHPGMYPQ